ncbi:MAG: cytochrome P450 [Elainellaceae cyanobacterium]
MVDLLDRPTPVLPDGPRSAPALQIFNWISRPYSFLDECAQKFGDVFTVRLGGLEPIVFCSDPDSIQAIFRASPGRFTAGANNQILRVLVGDASILLLDGDRHRRQRQLLMPPFHGERMRAYSDVIHDVTVRASQSWRVGDSVTVRPVMQEISLRVILEAVFGLHEGEALEQLAALTSDMLDVTSSPLSSSMLFFPWLQRDLGAWSPWGQFLQRQAQIDAILYSQIEARRQAIAAGQSGDDILSMLLAARDEAGNPMTDAELRDELMTLLIAGHETTASSLAWALYWMHQEPEIAAKLQNELRSIGQNGEASDFGSDLGSDFSADDAMALQKLPYLSAVCQEALRLYPVVPITFPRRVMDQPFEIKGHTLPVGTLVAPCIYLTHHHPALYPNSKRFRPERFLERQFSGSEFIPFGGGNRQCIGMAFALFEMKIVLATLLKQFDFTLATAKALKPVRRGLTVAPPPLRLIVSAVQP